MVRVKLLKKLLQVNSVSTKEHLLHGIVTEELTKLGFHYEIDSIGNISAVRGEAKVYPLLNAHMDIVGNYSYGYYGYGYGGSYNGYDGYDGYEDLYDYGQNKTTTITYINKEQDKTEEELYLDRYGYYNIGTLEELDYANELIKKTSIENLKTIYSCDDCYYKEVYCAKNNPSSLGLCGNFDVSNSRLYKVLDLDGLDDKDENKEEDVKTYNIVGVKYTSLTEEKPVIETLGETKKSTKESSSFKISIDNKGILKGDGSRILGGDDKCGIFIALEVARLLPHMPMKILFTVQEENGCIGIQHFIKNNEDWFDDILYSLTIDRRDCGDLLWSQLGVRSCSNEFAGFVARLGIQLGIPVQIKDGSVADVIYIRDLVPNAVNMSAGYYNPHTTHEYVSLSDVENITKWVKSILKTTSEKMKGVK